MSVTRTLDESTVNQNSFAMVVDSFGALGSSNTFLGYAYESLAKKLAAQGLQVSVIYTGDVDVSSAYSAMMTSQFKSQGIHFSQ
jgi:hypothetical protein